LWAVQTLGNRADSANQLVLSDMEVRLTRRGGCIGGQQHQRSPTLGSLREAGHHVGKPGPLVHAAHAHLATDASIRIGHDDCTTFVAGSNELGSSGDKGIGHRKITATDDAKYAPRAETSEEPTDSFGNQHGIG
jgi:hypothetical protein